MERSGTIAAEGVGEGDGVSVAGVVGVAVPSVGLTMADSNVLGGAYFGLVDGEVEGYDTVATSNTCCSVAINT